MEYEAVNMKNMKLLNVIILKKIFCSDFRYESNGIFVQGVVFFQTNFDFLASHFFIIRKVLLS